MSSPMALAKRHTQEVASMPPPPTKRIKRPSTVLDEDDYTNALSDIIARDYFPALAEAQAQDEYLTALDSNNDLWIREAGDKLKVAMTPVAGKRTSNSSHNGLTSDFQISNDATPVPDTPRGDLAAGSETPVNYPQAVHTGESERKKMLDTTNLSLSSFQAKYTSEDNESFNTLLDKQNNTRRKKHAHMWTSDQLIPSQRLLTHRAEQAKMLQDQADHKSLAAKHNEQALVPISVGATAARPASVQSWIQKTPANTLMFHADGIEETTTFPTVQETKEAQSKAGPKEIVHANTRFPPLPLTQANDDYPPSVPPSPSLNTTIIAHRDALRAAKPHSSAPTEISEFGGSTPRVNGYAFVDEDEPATVASADDAAEQPSYRDLLAGQVGDGTPNPFRISETRRREDLHLRLVARDQAKKREKGKDTERERGTGGEMGSMTPAARRLMEKLGRTPVGGRTRRDEELSTQEMWTPGATPRRKR